MTAGGYNPNPQGDNDPNGGIPAYTGGGNDYGAQAGAGTEGNGIGIRAGARIIDGIIVGVVSFLIAIVAGISVASLWVTVLSGILTLVYFVVLDVTVGTTPGKQLLGLSVRGVGGAPKPDAKASFIRNSWNLLGVIPYVGWLLSIGAIVYIAITTNSSPTHQGIHDKLAGGTQVVKNRK